MGTHARALAAGVGLRSTAVAPRGEAATPRAWHRTSRRRKPDPAVPVCFVDLLRRHGLHRRRARQQAGRAGPAGRRSGHLRLPAAGRHLELGRRASWPVDGESARADRLRAADRFAGAEPRRARSSRLAADGSRRACPRSRR